MSDSFPSDPAESMTRLPFWQRPWVQNVLPLLTSLFLHVIFAGALLLAYTSGCKVAEKPPLETQATAATSELVDTRPVADVQKVGLQGDPTRPPVQEEFPEAGNGWAPKPGHSDVRKVESAGVRNWDDEGAIIGLSATGGGFVKGDGVGPENGAGSSSGIARGPLAPFGLGRGGGQGGSLPTRFVNVSGGSASTVVFVCDASGSMINTFGSLKDELVKAVKPLKSIQGFNIIFFQDEKSAALDERELLFATPENKRKAFQWLETMATTGSTNPIPAIEQAFRQKPQLIYLLTDADFPDNDAVRNTIARLNADKQTRVNTIVFVSGDAGADDASESFVNLMKQIARDNGGVFGHVKESDLH
jgi:hypothetical protein